MRHTPDTTFQGHAVRLVSYTGFEVTIETEYMDSLGFASAMILATGMDCRNTFGLLKGLRISCPMALMEIRTLTPLGKF
jgi:hypothetical protein